MDTTNFGKSSIGVAIVGVIFLIKDVLFLLAEIAINLLSLLALKKYLNKRKKIVLNAINMENQSLDSNEANEMVTTRVGSTRVRHNKINKNLTYMVLVICILSVIGHVLTIACAGAFMLSQDIASYNICFASILFISFKKFFNFFIFLLFNSLFLNEFKLYMGFSNKFYI
jgi:hypothetical protein